MSWCNAYKKLRLETPQKDHKKIVSEEVELYINEIGAGHLEHKFLQRNGYYIVDLYDVWADSKEVAEEVCKIIENNDSWDKIINALHELESKGFTIWLAETFDESKEDEGWTEEENYEYYNERYFEDEDDEW